MSITVEISLPDDVLSRPIIGNNDDVLRRLGTEAVLAAYRQGHLTPAQVGKLLGLKSRYAVDEFLQAHEIIDYTLDDFRQDLATAKELRAKLQGNS